MISIDFSDMLEDWLMDLTLVTFDKDAPKFDNSGFPVKQQGNEKIIKGAFVSKKQSLLYREAGLLQEGSKVLFTLIAIPKKSQIIHKGIVYSVEDSIDLFDSYSDFNKYTCKRVGGVD